MTVYKAINAVQAELAKTGITKDRTITRTPQPAHVTEQEVMQCIRTGMQTAGEIKQHLGLSREGVSRPLRSLYRAGQVKPVGKRMVGNGNGGRVVVLGLV